jgi:protein O-mannosyl-transferase
MIYSPGLHGGFLFDDYANLPALGETGPINTGPAFWRYLTAGHADPFGRPLSQLSFLLDAQDWPADPSPFKRTNLLLHLFNGVLLALLLRKLGQQLRGEAHGSTNTDMAALLGSACWLLHPLLVSTTLYIVQREAILPALFTLIGLLLWLRGRHALLQGRTLAGLLWIAAGLGGCTVLATLSKANGVLLPPLALVIEYAFLRTTPVASAGSPASGGSNWKPYARIMLLFAWLPAIVIALYLAKEGWNGFVHGVSSVRPWTLGQRLLTEPRVLMDYLTLLWLPRPFTPGLFNDQVLASTSLWSPITTLPALCVLVALIVIGWRLRHRSPALATAILFYFVGQSLESSTVALELYFEHRNYLPAMLMFWPLALWLCHAVPAKRSTDKTRQLIRPALGVLILLGLGGMTYAGAELWGNTRDQALLWARLNPDSPRAQAYAAQVEMAYGHPDRAVARIVPLLVRYPDQVQLALNLFGAECQMGHVSAPTLLAAQKALSTARDPGSLLTSWFERAMDQAKASPCPELTDQALGELLDSALTNPYFTAIAGREQDIYYLKGVLAIHENDPATALKEFNHALDLEVRIEAALRQAAQLGAAGYPQQGLAHLEHFQGESAGEARPDFGMPLIHAWVLQRQQYWPREMARLQATLQRDAERQAIAHP